ncbi:MAG: glycosyltransferase [Acidobacteriota bacterium]
MTLRIVHLIHGLGLGGAQQVIKFIVQERGDDIEHLVYSCHGGVFQEQIEAAGGRIRILPRRLPKLDPFWVLSMARAMREDGVDIVHGHLFGDTLHGYLACRRAGLAPMVMTLHNSTDARSALQLAGYRWLLGRDTVPVACADFVRDSFRRHAGAVADRVISIPNGIAFDDGVLRRADRTAAARRLGLRPEALWLATVGRLAEQKAYPVLLKALQQMLHTTAADVQLVMFGDGPQRSLLEGRIAELGLGDRVVMAGFRDDVTALLPTVDVVVFSSIFEGLPIALLEAMACSRPVVATEVGGMPGALDDGREALLVPPRDADALAGALARITADDGLRDALGKAARARFEAQFTAATMVRGYEDLYLRVARDRVAEGRAEGP